MQNFKPNAEINKPNDLPSEEQDWIQTNYAMKFHVNVNLIFSFGRSIRAEYNDHLS